MFVLSFAIILSTFAFPTKISCCSDKATDIIDIIARGPEYRFDPCYIKWKAKEDAQIEEILKREGHEQGIETSDPSTQTNKRTGHKNRTLKQQNTYIDYATNKRKKSNRQTYMGFVAAIVVGIIICASAGIGCCAAFIYFAKRKKWTSDTNENNGFTVLSTTPGLAGNAWGNQTRNTISTTDALPTPTAPEMEYEIPSQINSGSSYLSANSTRMVRESTRQQPEINVPLVPKGVNRQNSLPSYDDVIRMPLRYATPNE